MNATPTRIAVAAVLAGACWLLAADPALAQDLATGGRTVHREGVATVRGWAAVIIFAGFLLWAIGRLQWWGGAVMACGVLGAIFSGPIADRLFGGA